ncbi:MAG TPA: hypothetical protein PKE57_07035 [Cellvibrionaceae bacterium]|nr:hypothetical protein [Cellvibrionaceae bacterium]HMW70173.1 hypothetical protein [Cellvibrionaceae bacterium]HNG59322.1 hypothetical protein [Cellvibrionaceae bacterium]
MFKINLGLSILTLCFISQAKATETGLIKTLTMSGINDPNHKNVVQIDFGAEIMNTPGCNKQFAAIRSGPENNHLISLALAASMAGKPITIELNSSDIYFSSGNRCTISRLAVSN